MNKETLDLVKQYVEKTLDEPNGISKNAYQVLTSLMQVNRDFAMEMHDIVSKIDNNQDRYFLLEDNEPEDYTDVQPGFEL
jgi:hypothetical protein